MRVRQSVLQGIEQPGRGGGVQNLLNRWLDTGKASEILGAGTHNGIPGWQPDSIGQLAPQVLTVDYPAGRCLPSMPTPITDTVVSHSETRLTGNCGSRLFHSTRFITKHPVTNGRDHESPDPPRSALSYLKSCQTALYLTIIDTRKRIGHGIGMNAIIVRRGVTGDSFSLRAGEKGVATICEIQSPFWTTRHRAI